MSGNKISIEDFKNAVSANFETTTNVNWHGIELNINRCLSFDAMMSFVNSVAQLCFAADTNEYMPEIKDFATRCCILEYYAGFDLPTDIYDRYSLTYSSDIVSFVVQYVDKGQFESILTAIDQKVGHMAQSNIEALTAQMNSLVADFTSLEQSLSVIFGGVNDDTISKIAEAIADGGFDEAKLVKAVAENLRKDDDGIVQFPSKDE